MPRRPQPWRRGGPRGPWYAQFQGKQLFLAPPEATKDEAHDVLDEIRRATWKDDRRPGGLTFRDVANLFTASAEDRVKRKGMAALTLEGYDRFLVPAAAAFGNHPVAGLKPKHVQAWLDGEPGWSDTTRNNAITAVKACLNWARKMGHVEENPIRDMDKPQAGVTETDFSEAQAARILGAVEDRAFRDYLVVLGGTGARPSEVMRIEAAHLDAERGEVVMDSKTTRRTGLKRVIYLAGDALEVLVRLAAIHPEGPLLRNTRGKPWTRHAVILRFRRLRPKLNMGKEATSKSFRHGFATDALEKGVPVATVAELLGHKGTAMVLRHYSKLRERGEHLRDAARTTRPGKTGEPAAE